VLISSFFVDAATVSTSAPTVTIMNGTYADIAVPPFKQKDFPNMPY
jgi:hypothetical protein